MWVLGLCNNSTFIGVDFLNLVKSITDYHFLCVPLCIIANGTVEQGEDSKVPEGETAEVISSPKEDARKKSVPEVLYKVSLILYVFVFVFLFLFFFCFCFICFFFVLLYFVLFCQK